MPEQIFNCKRKLEMYIDSDKIYPWLLYVVFKPCNLLFQVGHFIYGCVMLEGDYLISSKLLRMYIQ